MVDVKLSVFIQCVTELKATDSNNIDNVVAQWQHSRKKFDSHPLSGQRI